MDKTGRKHALSWDDDAFRARVATIIKKQGRSPDEVCLAAGLGHDTLMKPVRKGRNISTIYALANALHVDPTVLISGTNGAVGPADANLDSASLRRLALVAHVAAHLYVSLGEGVRPPSIEIERVMRVITSLIDPAPIPPEPAEPIPET